jgi:release factor glutamine methyltransferase
METDIKQFTVHSSRLSVHRILKRAEEILVEQGIQNPRYDTEALLSRTLNIDRVGLYTQYDRILSDEEVNDFLVLVQRRKKREPPQYILGSTEFFGLEFIVTPDVLIPRPETEILIEEVLKAVGSPQSAVIDYRQSTIGYRLNILDLCTGSGCIAVALAKKLRDARIYAVDISERALKIARENARRHGVEDRIDFIQGNLFEPFTVHGSRFDLIISNPPYIPSGEIDLLQREVKEYEPREALNGGPDGLFYLKKIIEEAPDYLKSDGSLLLEIGYGQKERVFELAEERGIYGGSEVIKDFAGIERVVKWIKS